MITVFAEVGTAPPSQLAPRAQSVDSDPSQTTSPAASAPMSQTPNKRVSPSMSSETLKSVSADKSMPESVAARSSEARWKLSIASFTKEKVCSVLLFVPSPISSVSSVAL